MTQQGHDELVLKLKEDIEKREAELGTKPKFKPETTCMFTYNGNKVNINVLHTTEDLAFYLVWFNTYRMSAMDLGFDPSVIKIDGFSIIEWMNDLQQKYDLFVYTEKTKKLSEMKKQLDALLSEDKQKQLQFEALAEMFKNL